MPDLEALRILASESVDVVVCDLRMPDMDGLGVLRAARQLRPTAEFILMTADADLSPMLFRLRAYNRRTVIYAGQGTSSAYRAYAELCRLAGPTSPHCASRDRVRGSVP